MPVKTVDRSPVTLGADPEMFLTNTNGKFISSVGKFGGTKAKPRPLGKIKGMAVQEDNVAVEFNIPPSKTKKSFVSNLRTAINLIAEEARALNLQLAIVPAAEFDDDELSHPAARHFGCDPDWNVWSLAENPAPRSPNKQLRSAGGHVHIAHTKDRIGLGRACDLFLGCPSIMFDPDQKRRLLYGKAGAIRQKEYGIEYRTLSNFWIKSPELMEMVFSQIVQAIKFVDDTRSIPKEDAVKIITCINTADQKLLGELTEKYGLMY